MKLKLFLAMNSLLIACLGQAASAETLSPTRQTADPNYSNEVLAAASFRNGRGNIEIRRITEDGVDGVVVARTGLIGDIYTRPAIPRGMPKADQMRIVFGDLTGQELPQKAYEALLDVEMLRAVNASKYDGQIRTEDSGAPRSQTCPDILQEPDYGFVYDCKWHGKIVKIRSGVDDVCLLTAAIEGNHGMQISYKSTNGNFYDNFHTDVTQGHYQATQVLTGVRRTRKGHIYKATNDFSRYAFNGDSKVVDATAHGYTDCELLSD